VGHLCSVRMLVSYWSKLPECNLTPDSGDTSNDAARQRYIEQLPPMLMPSVQLCSNGDSFSMGNICSFIFLRQEAQFCVSCQKLFSGDWQAQSVSQPSTGRGKLYAFHGSLQEIGNCAKTTSCPLCRLTASRGNWENANDSSSMAFVQIPGQDALFIHIAAADSSFKKDGLVIPMHLGT